MIITISRQSATNGLLVAQLVAQRLGYHIYDSELVDEIARRSQIDPCILQRFDEMPINPVASILWEWRSSICPESYRRYVRETMRAVAREGNAIVVGRGGNFILHGPDFLHVRLVAPLDLRIAMYCAGEHVTEAEARKWIKNQDERRAEYIRKYYNHSIDDPVCYDLSINLAGVTLEGAADIIVDTCRTRQQEHLTSEQTIPRYKELLAHRHPLHRPHVVQPHHGAAPRFVG